MRIHTTLARNILTVIPDMCLIELYANGGPPPVGGTVLHRDDGRTVRVLVDVKRSSHP
jgi:hypothetical protein